MGTARRLSGPTQITNAAVTKYTVPALLRGILRHIHVENPSAAPVNFTMSIGADAAATRLYDAYPIAAFSAVDFFCFHVLATGEIIQAFGSTTLVLVLVINGEEEVV
jgi:hypothetical protein